MEMQDIAEMDLDKGERHYRDIEPVSPAMHAGVPQLIPDDEASKKIITSDDLTRFMTDDLSDLSNRLNRIETLLATSAEKGDTACLHRMEEKLEQLGRSAIIGGHPAKVQNRSRSLEGNIDDFHAAQFQQQVAHAGENDRLESAIRMMWGSLEARFDGLQAAQLQQQLNSPRRRSDGNITPEQATQTAQATQIQSLQSSVDALARAFDEKCETLSASQLRRQLETATNAAVEGAMQQSDNLGRGVQASIESLRQQQGEVESKLAKLVGRTMEEVADRIEKKVDNFNSSVQSNTSNLVAGQNMQTMQAAHVESLNRQQCEVDSKVVKLVGKTMEEVAERIEKKVDGVNSSVQSNQAMQTNQAAQAAQTTQALQNMQASVDTIRSTSAYISSSVGENTRMQSESLMDIRRLCAMVLEQATSASTGSQSNGAKLQDLHGSLDSGVDKLFNALWEITRNAPASSPPHSPLDRQTSALNRQMLTDSGGSRPLTAAGILARNARGSSAR